MQAQSRLYSLAVLAMCLLNILAGLVTNPHPRCRPHHRAGAKAGEAKRRLVNRDPLS
jgi:hypothetical protein